MTRHSRHPIQQGIDLALVIPVAVIGRLRKRLPKLTRHVDNSKAVGKLVVERGLAQTTESSSAGPAPAKASAASARPDPARVPEPPSAIPDYASLAASQVVPRLAALTDDEVGEVAAYEMATRNRRTILAAVERRRS